MLAGGHSRFCRCDSSVNGIQCKLKWFPSSGFIFFFTLYFTGYGIVALSEAVITRMTGHALDEEMAKDYVLLPGQKD